MYVHTFVCHILIIIQRKVEVLLNSSVFEIYQVQHILVYIHIWLKSGLITVQKNNIPQRQNAFAPPWNAIKNAIVPPLI